MDAALAYSHNSVNWTAFGQGSAYVPALFPNTPRTATAGQVYPNTLIDNGDEGILIHASASTHQHGYVSPSPGAWSSILTYRLRRDGFSFASVANSSTGGGEFETKPLRWGGDTELEINADCNAGGGLRVSLLNARTGQEIDGYGWQFAIPFMGNSTSHVVEWSGGKRLSLIHI